MARKGLDGSAGADIPELREGVAGTGHEDVLVGGVDTNAHNIAQVVGKLGDFGARLDIPKHTGHVSGRRQDTAIVDESAAGQVTGVTGELASHAGRPVVGGEVVDGADVVETTAGNVITARGVSAGHDPGGAEGDGVHFVGGVRIPDDEFTVLGSGDEMATIRRPMHGVNFGKMALEHAARPHGDATQGIGVALSYTSYCTRKRDSSAAAPQSRDRRFWKRGRWPCRQSLENERTHGKCLRAHPSCV